MDEMRASRDVLKRSMGDLTALFDTSVLIGRMEGAGPALEGAFAVSVVALGELHAGVLLATHDPTQADRLRRLAVVLAEASVLDVDRVVTARYGELRSAAGRAPSNDL